MGLGWNALKHFPKIVTVVEMYGEGAAFSPDYQGRAGLLIELPDPRSALILSQGPTG